MAAFCQGCGVLCGEDTQYEVVHEHEGTMIFLCGSCIFVFQGDPHHAE